MKTPILCFLAMAAVMPLAPAVDVVLRNNAWIVKMADGTVVPCANNLFRAIETAVGRLPASRATKFTIRIMAGAGSRYNVSGGPAKIRNNGNVILDFGGGQGTKFNVTSGTILDIRNANNCEVRNLIATGRTTGIVLYSQNSNNLVFENINIQTPGGDIGIRPEGTWQTNSYATNVTVRGNCYFSGMKSGAHGIETMALDGFHVTGKVTTSNTGGCGILLNMTRNASIHHLDAKYASYYPGSSHNYAALRLANNCAVGKGIGVTNLEAYRCGRGFVATTSPNLKSVKIHYVNIQESANWGINMDSSPDNITIESGRSINNLWDGLSIGDAYNCTFSNLQLRGNRRAGLNIASSARNIRLRYVDVDSNVKSSVFSKVSIIDATGSDLTN